VLVALELDDRAQLDDGVELDVALFLAGGDLDLGWRDRVERLAGDGVAVVLRHRVAQRLVSGHLGAESGLEQLARRLARPEPGDPDLPGELAEGRVEGLVELFSRDGDVQPDLVLGKRLDRGVHEGGECIGRPRPICVRSIR
jgi:hypothetical protein